MDFGLGASEQSVSAVVKADFFSIQFLQTGFRHAQHQQITALAHQHISKSTHHRINTLLVGFLQFFSFFVHVIINTN